MANVVSELRKTSKGRLQYPKNWNPSQLRFDSKPQLNIQFNPFQIRNTSKLIINDNVKSADSFQTYFSPDRSEKKKLYLPDQKVTTNNERSKSHTKQQNNSSPTSNKNTVESEASMTSKQQSSTVESLVQQEHTQNVLNNINEEYEKTLKTFSNLRLQKMKMKMKIIEDEYKQNLQSIEEKAHSKHTDEFRNLQNEESKIGAVVSTEISTYMQNQQIRNKDAEEKERAAEKHRRDLENKIRKREEEKKARVEKIKELAGYSKPANEIASQIKQIYEKCKVNHGQVPQNLALLIGQVTQEYNNCRSIIANAVSSSSSDVDGSIKQTSSKLQTLEKLLKASAKILEGLEEEKVAEEKARIDAGKKAEEDMKKAKEAAEEETKRQVQTTTSVITSIAATSTTSIAATPPLASNISIATAAPNLLPLESMLLPILSFCSPKMAFLEYLHLQKLLSDSIKNHEPLSKSTESSKKKFKFDIYKIVNTNINALSDESPKHLLDKIMKMNSLLSGEQIQVGIKKITVKDNHEALLMSKELLARKLVLQGTSQVSSSFKAAFPIAAFAVGLWSLFPDVGELILSHFYQKCPYLVPFYIPKSKEMSTVDYCTLVGYTVDGQEIEAEDIYLKKLSGLVRLYAAIIQSDVPPQLGNRSHPHGLEHGWLWFTRILNLEPRPSVTAVIIFDFLEVAGNAMIKRFGKQFQKLLLVLCNEYLPKILKVTSQGSKAAEMRLKMFLDTCIKEGRIKEPEGKLTQRWWTSGR